MNIAVLNKEECVGCSACANSCKNKCITMVRDYEGFLYPKINDEKCNKCGLCYYICPVINNGSDSRLLPKVYGAICNDKKARLNSSSGGMFSAICEYVISNKGVVIGAQFSKEYDCVFHSLSEDITYQRFRGAKYIQSDLGNIFQYIKQLLDSNRTVFFCGAPCQVEAVLRFVGRKYDSLYTADFICHGVASPSAWKDYIKPFGSIRYASFRDKSIGWRNYCVRIEGENKKIIENHNYNKFMRTYLNNLCLRPSCYECGFKKIHRLSDFTLADYWKVQDLNPSLYDDFGTSLVFVHSQKGQMLFEHIKPNLTYVDVEYNSIIKANRSMIEVPRKPVNREAFMSILSEKGFYQAYDECVGENFKFRLSALLEKMKHLRI